VDDLARRQANRFADVRIAVTSVYVDDQEKALSFYTDVLGFGN
jgi:Glyoxalase/Bleomycin resistance protein/Dioxygenase superfamily